MARPVRDGKEVTIYDSETERRLAGPVATDVAELPRWICLGTAGRSMSRFVLGILLGRHPSSSTDCRSLRTLSTGCILGANINQPGWRPEPTTIGIVAAAVGWRCPERPTTRAERVPEPSRDNASPAGPSGFEFRRRGLVQASAFRGPFDVRDPPIPERIRIPFANEVSERPFSVWRRPKAVVFPDPRSRALLLRQFYHVTTTDERNRMKSPEN